MAALRHVIENHGLFCAVSSDRASHFFFTVKAGHAAVESSPTDASGTSDEGVGHPDDSDYSPQARGRSERNFATSQGRLPQELRIYNITTVDAANRFLRDSYLEEFNA